MDLLPLVLYLICTGVILVMMMEEMSSSTVVSILFLVITVYVVYDAYNETEEYNRKLVKTGQPPW